MRRKRKESEEIALSWFRSALWERGIEPIEALEITDSPDALFLINGHPVAVECRYIAHPKLLQFLGRRNFVQDAAYEIVVPREPHLWVRDAIVEKNSNIPRYLSTTGATEAWLLLHSSLVHPMLDATGGDGTTIRELLEFGARLVEHDFAKIWFAEIGPRPSPAFEIYSPTSPPPLVNWETYLAAFPAYPRDTYYSASVMVVAEGSDGQTKATVDFTGKSIDPVGLQPLDPRYTIDYAYLADPLRNANRTIEYLFFPNKPTY